jgi:acetyl/propionyl-CoA carboxylase alpha subunit
MRQRLKIGKRQFQVDLVSQDPPRIEILEDETLEELQIAQELPPGEGRLFLGDRFVPYFVTGTPKEIWVTIAGETYVFEKVKSGGGAVEEAHSGFGAPMPGKVLAVKVEAGQTVEAGQVLVIMEAMKMEHRIEAPGEGVVSALHCNEGDVVDQGFELLDFEPNEA